MEWSLSRSIECLALRTFIFDEINYIQINKVVSLSNAVEGRFVQYSFHNWTSVAL